MPQLQKWIKRTKILNKNSKILTNFIHLNFNNSKRKNKLIKLTNNGLSINNGRWKGRSKNLWGHSLRGSFKILLLTKEIPLKWLKLLRILKTLLLMLFQTNFKSNESDIFIYFVFFQYLFHILINQNQNKKS